MTVGVDCATADQQRQLHVLWQMLFAVQDPPAAQSIPMVTLRFESAAQPAAHVSVQVELGGAAHLAVAKTDAGFLLRCDASWLSLDVAQGCGTGALVDSFWRQPLEAQREFFLLAFLMLFQPLDVYGLHANGIVKDGVGYLVVGDSGHGKTTLALSLVNCGWQLLADDALAMRQVPDGPVAALALRRGFSCTPQTVARFPTIAATAYESPLLADGKRLIDVDGWQPGRTSLRCTPRVLLFPQIANRSKTALALVDQPTALAALIRQSPGILAARTAAANQMAMLARLVEQARCYCVLLGADVFEEPVAVAYLLWDAC